MPTHAKKMDKTGGNPPCVGHSVSMCWHSVGMVLAWCWHSVGMPQLGHLLVRPSVLNILHILAPKKINKINLLILSHLNKFMSAAEETFSWRPIPDPTHKQHATSFGDIPHLDIRFSKIIYIYIYIYNNIKWRKTHHVH